MPGLLKQGARCPKCGGDIDAIVRTENAKSLTAEYFHSKGSPKARVGNDAARSHGRNPSHLQHGHLYDSVTIAAGSNLTTQTLEQVSQVSHVIS